MRGALMAAPSPHALGRKLAAQLQMALMAHGEPGRGGACEGRTFTPQILRCGWATQDDKDRAAGIGDCSASVSAPGSGGRSPAAR